MSKREIRTAFESRLNAWAKDQSPAIQIAWENISFTPAKPYLRAFLVPASTDSIDLEGKHRVYTGIFQVNIVGEPGKGPPQVEKIAEDLDKEFPLNMRMAVTDGVVLVYSPMNQGPAMQEADSYTLPVWWRYRMDTI